MEFTHTKTERPHFSSGIKRIGVLYSWEEVTPMRKKRCRACHQLYHPEPRSYRRQKTCRKKSCKVWRKRRYQKVWKLKDPFYWEGSRIQQKLWRKNHKGYWRQWRKKHPGYVKRNRLAQRQRDAQKRGFLAKGVDWKAIRLDKLSRIKALRNLAKEVDWPRIQSDQIDAIVDYLKGEVWLAKQVYID